MFRRRISHDGDVVAVARRRLAALAAHHDADRQLTDASPGRPAETPLSAVDGAPPPAQHRVQQAGRHLGERRTELGRLGITGQHVTVVALCLLLLVIFVAWWALRSVPHAEQVNLSSHQQISTVTPTEAYPATASVPTVEVVATGSMDGTPTAGSLRLVVDVAGKVRHPGIVELPQGSRLVDAIAAAGGARPGVSLTSLNLAQLLVDGQQIVVGIQIPGRVEAPPSTGSSSGLTAQAIVRVPLNTATMAQLDTLPGIGPVTAGAILQWRADNGPFTAVDELLEVSGIGDATLADIRPYVYV